MTTANKRDEAIVLGALPGSMVELAKRVLVDLERRGFSVATPFLDTKNAIDHLKRTGKIRYNRSAKVWEKCE